MSPENSVTGRIFFVGAGPGDPDLITVRGLRELQQAQVILYDNLIDERILEGLAAEQGILFEIVPGVTSCVAGPAYAGIPVTHRGVADNFSVVTAHRSSERTAFSIPPYNSKNTVVLMMSLGSVDAWQAQMLEMKYPPELPVALIARAASASQRVSW